MVVENIKPHSCSQRGVHSVSEKSSWKHIHMDMGTPTERAEDGDAAVAAAATAAGAGPVPGGSTGPFVHAFMVTTTVSIAVVIVSTAATGADTPGAALEVFEAPERETLLSLPSPSTQTAPFLLPGARSSAMF
ncbi:unnamed protein product [Gongylonema pulchrum]|uniref:Uncharacterized protein n=1 Tax=Gongylonema pulchrum TaxID=637853 RepID=A0A183EI80_9BILA|nr:unnamed protein product [Gongylonema pulchrum]